MELFHANAQWSKRPEDERFTSLTSLYQATKAYADIARVKPYSYADMRIEAIEGDVQLVGTRGVPAKLTNWAFGQLCARVQAPASYMRELPATLACQNLNHGLKQRTTDDEGNKEAQLLFHANGSLLLRAMTSQKYERIWNWEIAERLLGMESTGQYEVAKPDIRAQDNRLPLYASDHDMFAFLRSTSKVINEPGIGEPLYRGFIVSNSEVGAATLKVMKFLYREMCGNHIIWGASNVIEMSLRHIGDIRNRWYQFAAQIRAWDNATADSDNVIIKRAMTTTIAATKEQVLDAIFGKRIPGLTKQVVEASYEAVKEVEDGPANTVWGFVQGATRHSQTLVHADARMGLDRAAGKLLEVDF